MEDIFKDIKAYLYERVSNPFGVTFVFSWALWNFRAILMIFSNTDIKLKYSYIDQYFQSVNPLLAAYDLQYSGYLFNVFCVPLLITLIYIFVSPILSLPAYRFSLIVKTKMVNYKKESESGQLLSNEDARNLRIKMALLKSSYEKQIDDANKQIEALTDKLNEVDVEYQSDSEADLAADSAKNKPQNSDVEEKIFIDNDIESIHEDIMELFKDGKDIIEVDDIFEHLFETNQHIIKQAMDEIVSFGWAEFNVRKTQLRLLAPGREYVLNMFLNTER